MASKKLTRREVIELLFADSDSEGENLTLGDDDRSISELASRSASLFSNGSVQMYFTLYKLHFYELCFGTCNYGGFFL